MKTLILLIGLILFLSQNACAQLKYEGTVDTMYKTFQLDDGTIKYIKYNKKEKKVLVFNLDRTLWREIKLPLPKDHLLDEIKHISLHTFNDDDLVELAYSCVVYKIPDHYEVPEEDWNLMEFTLNFINESGKTLLTVPGSNDMKIIQSGEGNKLLVYKHIGNHFKGNDETIIYSF